MPDTRRIIIGAHSAHAILQAAKAAPPTTPAQRQQNKISFAFGLLPEGSTITRDQIAANEFAQNGDLETLYAAVELLAQAVEMMDSVGTPEADWDALIADGRALVAKVRRHG